MLIDGRRYHFLDDDIMISMRYAQNLARGHGLVWNPGERVEGYTDFLWTVVMAGVHLLPVPAAKTALVVKLLNLGLVWAALVLAAGLVRRLIDPPGLALPVVLLSLAAGRDLLWWAVNGFSQTLLTVVFLAVVVRLLDEHETGVPRAPTYLLMGLLPLIRSDGHHVWAAAALLALGTAGLRVRTLLWLGLAALLPIAHLLFRHAYYGEWMPNAYFLKVMGSPGRLSRGLGYAGSFGLAYALPLALAVFGVARDRRRREALLLGGVAVSVGYSVIAGGDLWWASRFMAHAVPVVLALAAAAAARSVPPARRWHVPAMAVLLAFVWLRTARVLPWELCSGNGHPYYSVPAGVLIERYTRPDAFVASMAAGSTPYFADRRATDLLGRCDAHISHLPEGRPGVGVGHDKYDLDYSLGLKPDLIVTAMPATWLEDDAVVPEAWEEWCERALLRHPVFRSRYLDNRVPVEYLDEANAICVRDDSPERARLGEWKEPEIEW
jgi:hypothetical protein